MSMILGWENKSIDFSQAFVQEKLKEPIWVHPPRGFKTKISGPSCLRLIRSVYGTTITPKLWYELMTNSLKDMGFVKSKCDDCLQYKDGIMLVHHVDDLACCFWSRDIYQDSLKGWRDWKFAFTKEDSLSEYLGIKITKHEDGSISLTQPGLIKKVIETAKMEDCNPNFVPAAHEPLGMDPNGEPFDEEWDFAMITGMLQYLASY